ncbi:hypothetical protein GCM10027589_10790 [Actinocorallia lasiicapitis]
MGRRGVARDPVQRGALPIEGHAPWLDGRVALVDWEHGEHYAQEAPQVTTASRDKWGIESGASLTKRA